MAKQLTTFPTGFSDEMFDAAPAVLRAHAIADTIGALAKAGLLDHIEPDARDEVAAALRVPALWIHAALARQTVTLDLLHEWREWFDRLAAELDEAPRLPVAEQEA